MKAGRSNQPQSGGQRASSHTSVPGILTTCVHARVVLELRHQLTFNLMETVVLDGIFHVFGEFNLLCQTQYLRTKEKSYF